ncbi:MAG: NUDIX domain-containing protein [Kordiimonadaceae bacterium]|nr:NUDIX domain-containing protein [Kordiimonadaceae bacterium]
MNTITPKSQPTVKVAAALINDSFGRTLLVRKRGSDYFMQAGGKIEGTESPRSALYRELQEELGISIKEDNAEYLGRYIAPAANEEGFMVDAEMFQLEVTDEVFPAAEIVELAWITLAQPPSIKLAPLTRDAILPLARERSNAL